MLDANRVTLAHSVSPDGAFGVGLDITIGKLVMRSGYLSVAEGNSN